MGAEFAAVSIIVHISSWSYSYCCCRTLANTTEASLLVLGIYLWLVPHGKRITGRTATALGAAIAAFSCYVRPTALLAWGPLAMYKMSLATDPVRLLLHEFAPIGLMLLQVFVVVDSHYYGQLALTPYNFYWANVKMDMASLFGRHPWHWNFSNGLPTMLGLYGPMVVYGYYCQRSLPMKLRVLAAIALMYVVGLSVLSSHQEFRFLLPCLPIMHMMAAHAVCTLLNRGADTTDGSNMDYCSAPSEGVCVKASPPSFIYELKRGAFFACFVGHIVAASYLLSLHQSGTEAALQLVAQDVAARHPLSTAINPAPTTHVILAAPCYAFPGYAYIHSPAYPVQLHMPDCQVGGPALFDRNPVEQTKAMIAQYQLSVIQELSSSSSPSSAGAGACGRNRPHPAYDFQLPEEMDAGGDSVMPEDPRGTQPQQMQPQEGRECLAEESAVYVLTFDSYSTKLRPLLDQHRFQELYQVHHAHVPYDMDDPFPKMMVEVFQRMHPVTSEGSSVKQL